MNPGEIDDFLAEVDLVSKKVHDLVEGKISPEEIDRFEEQKKQEKETKEKIKVLKEEEKAELIKKGRAGKGQGEDYKNFCMGCFTEYTLETPKCLKCGNDTITKQQRHDMLMVKLEEYKQKKASREERKNKWENWRKTQAIYWKKTATNYSKWDYFTSDSEEEEEKSEPILPKNDPNFLALEKDFEDRAKRRKQDQKVALQMKDEGNEYMKNRDFLKAIEAYTIGLEKARDMKELYTNRALAYIKLGNYEKAISDCDRVLEYIEFFDKGYDKMPEISFKALIRRAQAYRETGQIDTALGDIDSAMKLKPNDKEAIRLKSEFELYKEQKAKASEFMDSKSDEGEKPKNAEKSDDKSTTTDFSAKEACIETVDKYMNEKQPSNQITETVTKLFKLKPEFKIYANEKGIAKKISDLLLSEDYDKMIYLLIITFIQQNPIYIEEFFKHLGPTNMYKRMDKLTELLEKTNSNKSGMFQEIEEICETFLNFTEQEKGRILLRDQPYLIQILSKLYTPIVQNISGEKEAATSFFSLISNLIIVSDKFAKYLETNYLDKMIDDFLSKVLCKTKTSKYNRLKENLYGVLANLLRDDGVRVKFLNIDERLERLYNLILQNLDGLTIQDKTNLKWIKSVESIFGIFINLTHGVTKDVLDSILIKKYNLFARIARFFKLDYSNQNYFMVIYRVTQLSSKLKFPNDLIASIKGDIINTFSDHFDERAKQNGLTNHSIRLYLKWFNKENEVAMKQNFSIDDIGKLVENINKVLKESDEERFVNASILAGNISEIYPEMLTKFKDSIPILLEVCKSKTGVLRKNAGIVVAKLSKHPDNITLIRDLHGIEILSSISKFILEK